MNTINEAKAFGAKLKSIHRAKFLEEQRECFSEYAAESRACGYEVETFAEYIGERDLKSEFAEFYAGLSAQELQDY
jgi:hypothetical protein